MTILFMLSGCTNKYLPSVVTEYLPKMKPDIPSELLTPEPAPSADVLKGVEVTKGKEKLISYGMGLLHANYVNSEKINALKELLHD
jgi:hypothetical protein